MNRHSLIRQAKAFVGSPALAFWDRRSAAFGLGVCASVCALLAQPSAPGNLLESQFDLDRSLITTDAPPASTAAPAVKGTFAGRWDLTLHDANGKEMPSWLELTQAAGKWQASFVGRWGSARPLPRIAIAGDRITFVSPKEEEGSRNDLVFEGTLTNDSLNGTALGPNGARWSWTGARAPALPQPAAVNWADPQKLFNGVDFTGWTFDDPTRSRSWTVAKGCLVNLSAGANLVTTGSFQNFKLHVEVQCPPKANSGIYLRGRYEVQVEDDSFAEPPSHHMGAIYGFLAPNPEQPRRPGEWQSFDITLLGRFVTVVQNGQIIIDDQEIPGITGGALNSHEELPGPIYLQGDHGGIAYRNLVLTPMKP